jgi:translation initiation factor 3 subunit M
MYIFRTFESYTQNLKALSLPSTNTNTTKPDPVTLFNTALALPTLYHYDALHQTLTATSKLQALPAASQALLAVLVSGSYKDFKALKITTPNAAETARKMRLLTLVDLARESVVGFKEVREALEVEEGMEEEWVVEGMRAGLIEGKMNQLKGIVTIR